MPSSNFLIALLPTPHEACPTSSNSPRSPQRTLLPQRLPEVPPAATVPLLALPVVPLTLVLPLVLDLPPALTPALALTLPDLTAHLRQRAELLVLPALLSRLLVPTSSAPPAHWVFLVLLLPSSCYDRTVSGMR
ncbi:hypothetical protein M426DRAFT_164717 [Hypoxylon sp. CI-4A]|nr:hypothetical protein M426DRAFT_164717 [Hypoxylon sp. CI-4A]